mgnify:CR=1 FL=1
MTKSVFTDEYRFMLDCLAEARERAGLSQRQLSRILEKPSSFVNKYETGERRLDVIKFTIIAKALNLNALHVIKKISEMLDA